MAVLVSEKGWIVIPAELRKKYGLLPGTEVQVIPGTAARGASTWSTPGDRARQGEGTCHAFDVGATLASEP